MPALLFSMIGLTVVSVMLLRYLHDHTAGMSTR